MSINFWYINASNINDKQRSTITIVNGNLRFIQSAKYPGYLNSWVLHASWFSGKYFKISNWRFLGAETKNDVWWLITTNSISRHENPRFSIIKSRVFAAKRRKVEIYTRKSAILKTIIIACNSRLFASKIASFRFFAARSRESVLLNFELSWRKVEMVVIWTTCILICCRWVKHD